MARTSVDVDDELIATVMRTYRLDSKRAAIDFALRRVLHDPLTTDDVLALEGTGWAGDLDLLRDVSPEPLDATA